jgi:antitoxin MazE
MVIFLYNLAKKQYRKIGKLGNSLGISIPKEYVEEMNIQQGDVWEITKEGGQLVIKPIKETQTTIDVSPEVLRAFDRAIGRYDQAFKNLRDR